MDFWMWSFVWEVQEFPQLSWKGQKVRLALLWRSVPHITQWRKFWWLLLMVYQLSSCESSLYPSPLMSALYFIFDGSPDPGWFLCDKWKFFIVRLAVDMIYLACFPAFVVYFPMLWSTSEVAFPFFNHRIYLDSVVHNWRVCEGLLGKQEFGFCHCVSLGTRYQTDRNY